MLNYDVFDHENKIREGKCSQTTLIFKVIQQYNKVMNSLKLQNTRQTRITSFVTKTYFSMKQKMMERIIENFPCIQGKF